MSIIPEIQGAVLAMRGDTVLVDAVSAGLTATSRFQIASVSKQFTAAAVLLLAQRDAVRLSDRIGRWIADCPPAWQDITLHHLLAHTSGLGHWEEHPMIDLARRMPEAELLDAFFATPPLFTPGAGWHYSSPGYVLLAHVVQRAADRPYRDVLAEEIFGPLELADTFAGSPGDRPDVAQGHGVDGRPMPSWDLDVVGMGAGDIWSTAGDLIRWVDGLRAGRLLDARRLGLMFDVHAATGGGASEHGYGYGWQVGVYGDEPWFHHSGDNAGFKAFAAFLPTSDRRLVVLSNTDATDPVQLGKLLTTALG